MEVMTRAWEIARAAEKESGYKAVEFFAESLKMAWAEKKAASMTEDEKIAALEAKGFKRWTKYGHDRLYINATTLLDLDVRYRGTGTIRYSALNGEEISHSEAYKLVGAKLYVDLKDWSTHVQCSRDWEADEILTPALNKMLEGIA